MTAMKFGFSMVKEYRYGRTEINMKDLGKKGKCRVMAKCYV